MTVTSLHRTTERVASQQWQVTTLQAAPSGGVAQRQPEGDTHHRWARLSLRVC